MRRRYIVSLAIAIVVLVLVTGWGYSITQANQPPAIVLTYQGNTYSGVLESYCWPSPPQNGICQLAVNMGRTDFGSPVMIKRVSSVAFQVTSYPNQSMFSVEMWKRTNNTSTIVAIKQIAKSLSIALPVGDYYFTASTKWDDGRAVAFTYEVKITT